MPNISGEVVFLTIKLIRINSISQLKLEKYMKSTTGSSASIVGRDFHSNQLGATFLLWTHWFPLASLSSRLVPKLRWLLLSGVATCLFWREGERWEVTAAKRAEVWGGRGDVWGFKWAFKVESSSPALTDGRRLIPLSFSVTEGGKKSVRRRGEGRQNRRREGKCSGRESDGWWEKNKGRRQWTPSPPSGTTARVAQMKTERCG